MPDDVLRTLPRGPHGLGRDAVRASQRRRMLDALTEAVADGGFGRLTVTDVVSRAGVSRKTFYEHFSGRDDCFMAAYEDGLLLLRTAMLQATTEAIARGDGPAEQLRASVRAYLGFLADRPALARTFVLEVLAAGPHALARRAEAYREFAEVTRLWHLSALAARRDVVEVPEEVYEAVVGAGHGMVAEQVRQGRTAMLRELEPLVMYVHLALLGSRRRAVQELDGVR